MNDKKVKEKTVIKPKPDENALYKPSKNPTPTNTEKPKVDDNSLFKPGAYGTPNNSKGDGEGGGKGDQGDPSGDPNSKSYKGSGTGTGTGTGSGNGSGNVNLSGRSVLSRHVPKNPCEQTRGKVMVAIRVNRQGQVTSANYAQGGSTTADDCLVNVALQAARKYTFDVKSDAAEIQNGTILFMFKEN
jgi:outer membrane biosynthesis protein TonB